MTTRAIRITDDIAFGGDNPPLFIAGPCVIESREHVLAMARPIRALRDELKINLVFKASFDKANRTSIESFRGPGLEKGLALLKEVKAGLAAWFVGMLLVNLFMWPQHLMPAGLTITTMVVALVEWPIACVVGAKFYTEGAAMGAGMAGAGARM